MVESTPKEKRPQPSARRLCSPSFAASSRPTPAPSIPRVAEITPISEKENVARFISPSLYQLRTADDAAESPTGAMRGGDGAPLASRLLRMPSDPPLDRKRL